MSVGPMGGIATSAAGTPLAQAKGSEIERAQEETGTQQRRVQSDLRAESAAGIGETDGEDHEAAERDADGRRPWEEQPKRKPADQPQDTPAPDGPPRSKDATGQSGTQLDLTG